MSSRTIRAITLAAALAAFVILPLVVFPFYRDNLATHFPLQTVVAEQLRSFQLPLWNPHAGGGQPLGGNPNSLAFYPTALLHFAFGSLAAYTFHFLIHWIGGALAMALLLRTEDATAPWAWFGATLWLLSGAAISLFAFYNLITAALWVPLAFLAISRLGRRADFAGALLLGCTFGAFALAGEPVILLGTALACAILATRYLSGRFVAMLAVAVAVALLVASPMVLAWSEVAPELERGARVYSAETVLAASLSPWELLEIFIGPVRGLITDGGPGGLLASGTAERWPPLFIVLFLGALALPAIVSAATVHRRHQVAAIVLLVLALGSHNPLVRELVERFESLRFGRYPEKLAIPASALLVVLMTGWLARQTRNLADRIATLGGAGAVALLMIAALAGAGGWPGPMRLRIILFGAVAIGALSVAVAAPTPSRRRALALLTILPAAVVAMRAIPLDWRSPYRDAPPPAVMFQGERVVRFVPEGTFGRGAASIRVLSRISAAAADPTWGAAFGLHYALDRSPDGMYSLLSRIAQERFVSGDPERMARWAAITGARAIVSEADLESPPLRAEGAFTIGPRRTHVYLVRDPLPMAIGIPRVESVTSINEAVARIESGGFDPRRIALAPPGWETEGEVAVGEVRNRPGRWSIDVRAPAGGALLVNESFFRAWRATDQSGAELGVFPMNVDRLGIRLPPGTTRVEVEFGRRRGWIAGAWTMSWLLLVAGVVVAFRAGMDRPRRSGPYRHRSRTAIASPAR